MSDMESRLDNRIARIAGYDFNSDMYFKYACLGAATIVGTYSGMTEEIAKRRNRSVSTVQNWAHAAWLYKDLRKVNRTIARELWRSLPASHWWLAYDIHQKGYNALYYLALADAHNWSGRAMLQEFDVDLKAGNAKLQIRRAITTIKGLADELLKSNSCNDEQIDALMKVQEVFKS